MFQRNSRQDTFKYLNPSSADKCWRELVRSASREHPFNVLMDDVRDVKFPSARQTMYHSTYSFPMRAFTKRMKQIDAIPPAGNMCATCFGCVVLGRSSFYRDVPCAELSGLEKEAKHQSLLANHHRNELKRFDDATSRSLRSSVYLVCFACVQYAFCLSVICIELLVWFEFQNVL